MAAVSDRQTTVAVVIAVRNGVRYIAQTVRSALAQGLTVDRVVVVDDGSSDGTAEAVAAISDPRVLVVRNLGSGVSSARNFGVTQTASGWLIFLDADDLLQSGAADHLLAVANAASTRPAGVYGDYERIDADGRAFGRRHLMRGRRAKPNGRILNRFMRGNFIINGGVLLVARDAFERSGGFDPTLSLCEDWHCWCRLAALGPILYTPRHVMDYRVHGGSIMMGGHRRFADFRPALERIYSDPAILAALDQAILPGTRREAEVSLMTYCAAQAYRNGARWQGIRLALEAITHHPAHTPYVAARFGGAIASL